MNLQRFFHRRYWDEERARELEAYLEEETSDNIARGMNPEEASRAAHLKLGNTVRIREEIYHMNSLNWLESLWKDVRYALRQLRRNPGFTAVAILTLALGIGANTAIFTVVNGVLLRPLPLPHPERVIFIEHSYTTCPGCSGPLSYLNFSDFEHQNSVFESLSMYNGGSFNLRGKASPERVPGAFVSANYFATMGVEPVLGRTFLSGEDQAGRSDVALIGAGLWHSQLGGDPGILGKTIFLNDRPVTVVGIMPERFRFPFDNTEAWVPLVPDPHDRARRDDNMYQVVGRLKAGVTLAEAQAQMGTIAGRLAQTYPDTDKDETVRMTPLQEALVGGMRQDLLVLMVAVAFVFLIASANVVNLLLARTAVRQREVAIRLSVGAGRGRLLQQFLTESLLLAAAGAVAGWVMATLGVDALLILKPANLPRAAEIHPDAWVLLFTTALATAATLALGVAAARKAFRANVQEVLREGAISGTASPRRVRGRSLLVASEIAIAVPLLVGAGLLVKSLWRLLQVRPGLNPEHVLTMQLSLPETRYPDQAHIVPFYNQLLQRVQALPGVDGAGLVTLLPLQRSWMNGDFELPWYTIVGVVGNVRQAELSIPIQFETDVPYTQWPPSWPVVNGTMSLVLRTPVDPAGMANSARRAVLSIDPDQPVFDVETMPQVVSHSMAGRQFNMILLSLFAALALLLASLGIYGVLSYAVKQRAHEIGIRMALGATRGDVLRTVVWQGTKMAAIGLACGLGGALALTRLMADLLYGVKPTDLFTFVAVSLVLGSLATLASYIPARRATKVDPMVALRYE